MSALFITLISVIGAAVLFIAAMGGAVFFRGFTRSPLREYGSEKPRLKPELHEYETELAKRTRLIKTMDYEPLYVKSFDGLVLYGAYIPPAGRLRGVVICAHGYHGGGMEDYCAAGCFYIEQGFGVILIDHRAHGRSEGKYITFGIKESRDIKTWVDFASKRFLGIPLFLSGLSMGATSVLMAAPLVGDQVRAIMADCGFTSPSEQVAHVMELHKVKPWLLAPVVDIFARAFAGFSLFEYSTIDAMTECRVPVLFVHGGADTFVPPNMSRRNFEACASEQKELLIVDGAAHALSWLKDEKKVTDTVMAFIASVCKE